MVARSSPLAGARSCLRAPSGSVDSARTPFKCLNKDPLWQLWRPHRKVAHLEVLGPRSGRSELEIYCCSLHTSPEGRNPTKGTQNGRFKNPRVINTAISNTAQHSFCRATVCLITWYRSSTTHNGVMSQETHAKLKTPLSRKRI